MRRLVSGRRGALTRSSILSLRRAILSLAKLSLSRRRAVLSLRARSVVRLRATVALPARLSVCRLPVTRLGRSRVVHGLRRSGVP